MTDEPPEVPEAAIQEFLSPLVYFLPKVVSMARRLLWCEAELKRLQDRVDVLESADMLGPDN